MNTRIPIVILSAELSSKFAEANAQSTEALRLALRDSDIPYREVKGIYKGTSETSFMLVLPWEKLYVADRLRDSFEQESYLLIDSNSLASLEFEGGSEILGKFTELTQVPMHGDYTLINGVAYGIR